jgi:hypothetical protein
VDPLAQIDFGRKLESSVMERGLRELCPDITFDHATNHGQAHPWQERCQGIFFRGRHVCAMDRGLIPEITVWARFKRLVEIPWYAADREDAAISYSEILPTEPGYRDLYEAARKNNDPSLMVKDGKLLRLKATGYEDAGRRCMRVGWRHTFAKLLAAGLPGITAQALAEKFNIDANSIGVLAQDGVPVEEEPTWQPK